MSNLGKYRLYKFASLFSFLLPFAVLVGVNYQMFISFEVTKISLYGYIVMIFVVVAFKTKIMGTAKKNPLLTMSIVLLITSMIMRNYSYQLTNIAICGIVGSSLSSIFEPVADVFFNECYEINGEHKRRVERDTLSHKQGFLRAYK